MELAVKGLLAGVSSQLTTRATLETRVLRGFKASEKTGVLPGSSPQQAESLAAGVRPVRLI